MRPSSAVAVLALAIVSFSLPACSSSSSRSGSASALGDDAITIGSFNFPESELLARIYGGALQRGGYRVRYELGLGPREFVDPALARGLLEFVPEYAGSALQFLTRNRAPVSSNPTVNYRTLVNALRSTPIEALNPAPATDANAVVVTRRTASEGTGLRTISDLRPVAPNLTFAGPPECPTRPFCLKGLQDVYKLHFKAFVPIDAGGPLTLQALRTGQIDAAVLFTTDPNLVGGELVQLRDDRNLQPAENVTPLVRREVVRRFGAKLVRVVDRVSANLDTAGLARLNGRVIIDKRTPAEVARAWLRQKGFR